MPGTGTVASSIGDQETDRSLGNEIDAGGPVVFSVPTMIRSDDEIDTNTDLVNSNYNPNYSIQTFVGVISIKTFISQKIKFCFSFMFLTDTRKSCSTK